MPFLLFVVLISCLGSTAKPKDVDSEFIAEIGHRARVFIHNGATNLLPNLLEVDAAGYLDDIAEPAQPLLSDISIFFLEDPSKSENILSLYPELEPIREILNRKWVNPYRIIDIALDNGVGGKRSLRLVFTSDNAEKFEEYVCFVKSVYGSAIYKNDELRNSFLTECS